MPVFVEGLPQRRLCVYLLRACARFRVVNGPTSSGPNPTQTRKYKPKPVPNPKTNLKPEETCKLSWSEKFSYVAKLFRLYFCAPKTKSTYQARVKPKILSTLGPNPARTRTKKPGPTFNSGSIPVRCPFFFTTEV